MTCGFRNSAINAMRAFSTSQVVSLFPLISSYSPIQEVCCRRLGVNLMVTLWHYIALWASGIYCQCVCYRFYAFTNVHVGTASFSVLGKQFQSEPVVYIEFKL